MRYRSLPCGLVRGADWRQFSIPNPADAGCNSDLAQYSNTPSLRPNFSSTSKSTRTILMRPVRTMILGAVATSMSLFPSGLLAATTATIELSPMVAKSALVSFVDAATEISVVLTIPLGDSKGAADFAQRVSNPKDPLHRKYITPQEFTAGFGANVDDYAALKQWAMNNGLRIQHEALARSFLTVRGTAAQFQTLFKTQLNNYRSPDGEIFYSAETKPTIPDAIAPKVSGVIGLTNSIHYAPLAKVYKTFVENAEVPVTDTAGGTGPGGAYSASDLRTAYQIPAFGRVAPQTVAVFEQGGFLQSDDM